MERTDDAMLKWKFGSTKISSLAKERKLQGKGLGVSRKGTSYDATHIEIQHYYKNNSEINAKVN